MEDWGVYIVHSIEIKVGRHKFRENLIRPVFQLVDVWAGYDYCWKGGDIIYLED